MTGKPRLFAPRFGYIPNGFSRRCSALFEECARTRTPVIGIALPGEGKSWTLGAWRREHPVERKPGITTTELLCTPSPGEDSGRNALMYLLGARLGRLMRMSSGYYLPSLVSLAIRAGVTHIIVDDAHQLTRPQRRWLREFVELLAAPQDPELEPLAHPVGVVYLAAGTPEGPQRTPLFEHVKGRRDIDWIQFERRLDGMAPIRYLEGLDLAETGEVLAGFEVLYRPQFPALELQPYTTHVFDGLLHGAVDCFTTRRVRIDSLAKLVLGALAFDAMAGDDGSGIAAYLQQALQILQLRPHEFDALVPPFAPGDEPTERTDDAPVKKAA